MSRNFSQPHISEQPKCGVAPPLERNHSFISYARSDWIPSKTKNQMENIENLKYVFMNIHVSYVSE